MNEDTTTDEARIYPTFRIPKILIILGVLVLVAGAIVVTSDTAERRVTRFWQSTFSDSTEPVRSDLAGVAPEAIPAGFIVETGAVLNQSYVLTYSDSEQSTAVFSATLTLPEAYTAYQSLLNRDGWTITSKLESTGLASLYALKDERIINVTIIPRLPEGSEISVTLVTTF
jgi:hypothetical protein